MTKELKRTKDEEKGTLSPERVVELAKVVADTIRARRAHEAGKKPH